MTPENGFESGRGPVSAAEDPAHSPTRPAVVLEMCWRCEKEKEGGIKTLSGLVFSLLYNLVWLSVRLVLHQSP